MHKGDTSQQSIAVVYARVSSKEQKIAAAFCGRVNIIRGSMSPLSRKTSSTAYRRYWTRKGVVGRGSKNIHGRSMGSSPADIVVVRLPQRTRRGDTFIIIIAPANKGRCPERYGREEEIAAQFGEALRAIQLNDEVLAGVTTALRQSHQDARRYHHEMIASLQKQYQRLQDRLDRMYLDKLDGSISQDYFNRMSESFQKEQRATLQKIEQHQSAHESYVEEGVRLLELTQKAVILYEKQEMQEKRKLLDFVCSNSTWKDGKLIP
jgi:hypothetical protein